MQLIGKVPRDQFDVPVDMVVTESRVIRCRH
jgi:5-formyltetrahydrofolate cyclo-ligase